MEFQRYFYYPSNFNLEGFCNIYQFEEEKVAKFLDLLTAPQNFKNHQRARRLYSGILKNIIGINYSEIILALLQEGVIENITGYEIGVSSRSFQLTDKYYYWEELSSFKERIDKAGRNLILIRDKIRKQNITKEIVNRTPLLDRKYNPINDSKFNNDYKPLIENFFNNEITIDIKEANKILETIDYDDEVTKLKSYKASIHSIINKAYFFQCDKNLRFYSPFTNLPKILRSAIRVNGEKLIGIDVSNTQPFLLSHLADDIFLEKIVAKNIIKVDRERFLKLIKLLRSKPYDLIEFKRIVESGKIYESLIGINGIENREVVKEFLLKIINDKGKSKDLDKERIRNAFSKKYPTIYELIEVIKSVNYKNMSTVLMSMEASEFVIWFPQNFYYDEKNKNIPLFTIHDCFLTTESNIEYFENWFKEYFKEKEMHFSIKRE